MKRDPLIKAFNKRYSHRRQERMFVGLIGALIALVFCRTCSSEPKTVYVEVTPEVMQEITYNAPESLSEECLAVARVLYGVKDYNLSENAKTAVVEVILNRVADTAREFRTLNTIVDVCEQPNQWQGYVSDGAYLKEDYDLAKARLADTTGARVTPEGCYFLTVTQGKVTVRTLWDGGNEWSVQ